MKWASVKRRERPARKHRPLASRTERMRRSGKPSRAAASLSLIVAMSKALDIPCLLGRGAGCNDVCVEPDE